MLARFALAAGIALAAGNVAHAEPAFGAFQRFCFDHRAARPQALADADASGWTAVPKAMLDKTPFGAGAAVDGRMKTEGAGALILLAGKQTRKLWGRDVPTDVCAVAMIPGDREQLKASAELFAGVAPTRGAAESVDWFIWRDQGGRRVPVALAEEKTVASDVQVLLVAGDSQFAVIGLIVPLEVSPN